MCIFNSGETSTSSIPPVVAPPAPVDNTKDTAQSLKAREDERKRALAAKGRKSTILTSPLGVTGSVETVKPSLLGQAAPIA